MFGTLMLTASKKATPTPVPGVGTQVAADLKDTVSSAAETAGDLLGRMPVMISRLLIAAAVLIVGLIILKIGKLIIAGIAHRMGRKTPFAARRAETFRSIITSVFSYIIFFAIVMVALHFFDVDVSSMLAAAG